VKTFWHGHILRTTGDALRTVRICSGRDEVLDLILVTVAEPKINEQFCLAHTTYVHHTEHCFDLVNLDGEYKGRLFLAQTVPINVKHWHFFPLYFQVAPPAWIGFFYFFWFTSNLPEIYLHSKGSFKIRKA